MERKIMVEKEIEDHLSKIKQLRAQLEEEERDLDMCYRVLNSIENNN